MRADALLTHIPQTAPAPGTPLWGEPPRKQPIVPLIAMAILVLLVCAPTAMSGNGQSSNPLALMRQTAISTYEMAKLVDQSNGSLVQLDKNTKPLGQLAANMEKIAAASGGMADKTTTLSERLTQVGEEVSAQKTQLKTVDGKLATTAAGMSRKRTLIQGSLTATKSIVGEFKSIDTSITSMDKELKSVIGLMALSTPQTEAFANNTTRLSIAGGDGHKFGVPNIVKGSRVMSVMLPMIATMQKGGATPARKDSAEASNPLVGTLLARQVPDGTNVNALIQPYDGYYGLPGPEWFVNTPVAGF